MDTQHEQLSSDDDSCRLGNCANMPRLKQNCSEPIGKRRCQAGHSTVTTLKRLAMACNEAQQSDLAASFSKGPHAKYLDMLHHLRVSRHDVVTGNECGVTGLLADSAPKKFLSCIAQEEAVCDGLIGTVALDGYASTNYKPTKKTLLGTFISSTSVARMSISP